MNEQKNLYTYPQPTLTRSAFITGSLFGRHGGSNLARRGHTRRYEQRRPILVTTNKVFGEWNQVFPNASCVGTLIDRLLHRAEILALEGKSYRLKEAEERAALKAKARSAAARKKR